MMCMHSNNEICIKHHMVRWFQSNRPCKILQRLTCSFGTSMSHDSLWWFSKIWMYFLPLFLLSFRSMVLLDCCWWWWNKKKHKSMLPSLWVVGVFDRFPGGSARNGWWVWCVGLGIWNVLKWVEIFLIGIDSNSYPKSTKSRGHAACPWPPRFSLQKYRGRRFAAATTTTIGWICESYYHPEW